MVDEKDEKCPSSAKGPEQRLKILYLYEIFHKYTDSETAISMPEIIDKLEQQGITAARKALYQDIEALRGYGLDISETKGRGAGYRLESRDFEFAELKLLADAVVSSKFMTVTQSNMLLSKIEKLCSLSEAKQLRRQVFVTGRVKQANKGAFYNVDTIQRALLSKQRRCKISFRYFDYDMDKKKRYRDGLRVCSPYALVWDSDKYYLVGYYEKRDGITNFRVDRMEDVQILDEPAVPVPEDFNLPEYLNATFSMFSGDIRDVKLRFKEGLVNSVLDCFGWDVRLIHDGSEHFTVHVKVKAEAPFFGWLFQFGSDAQIISPPDLNERYLKMLHSVTQDIEQRTSSEEE